MMGGNHAYHLDVTLKILDAKVLENASLLVKVY